MEEGGIIFQEFQIIKLLDIIPTNSYWRMIILLRFVDKTVIEGSA